MVLLAIYTLLAVNNSLLYRSMKGIHWFSLYNLFALLGAGAVALRGQIPDFISIVMGNVFVMVGYFLLFLSITSLFGRRSRGLYTQAALVVVGIATMLQWGFIEPNTKPRLVAYSLVLFCQQVHIAVYLMRKRSGQLRTSGTAMALILATLSLSNMVRVAGVALHGAPANYLNAGAFLAWILIVNSCLQCGAMVAYVWMTAALLRADLQRQASTDPLTGLLNRRAIELSADEILARCQRGAMPACALILDLDGFKQINDAFGHSCGDAALIAVAECMRRELGRQDLLARLGGDEFAVLLPDTTLGQGMQIAERLRGAIERTEIDYAANDPEAPRPRLAASFGLTQAAGSGLNWEQLMTRCDQALYTVKRDGGNRVGLPEPVAIHVETGATAVSLESALSVGGESTTIV